MNQAGGAPPARRIERSVPPGTRLGRYEIMTHLASGGMASVFVARALGAAGFHRLVAIKVLHPHVAADEQFTHMFLDEARLAARIRHPNVVPTLDLQHGEEGDFLVMEFVEGESLLGLLRQGFKIGKPIPPGIAIRVVLDALEGLHAAHELRGDYNEPLNLVHRDVSPHNILVGVDGIARIVDFGIARAEERMGTTRDGQVKGKLAYMAPEQTTSEPVDRRVDVFTTGIVLWECLAQRRLFRGQTDAEVLRMLLEKPIPPLREIHPEYPAALEDVCARALQRPRDERFATAAEFAEALEKAAQAVTWSGAGAPMVGIASSRQVAAYVREVAGDMIDPLMRRVRAFQEGRTPSVPPPPVRTEPMDCSGDAHSSVRASAPDEWRRRSEATTNIPVDVDDSAEVAFRSRKTPKLLFVMLALLAAGAVFVGARRTRTHSTAAPLPPPPPTTSIAPPTVITMTPAVDTAPFTATATVIDTATVTAPSVAPHHHHRSSAATSASAAPSATEAPSATAAPSATTAPSAGSFNPEAM